MPRRFHARFLHALSLLLAFSVHAEGPPSGEDRVFLLVNKSSLEAAAVERMRHWAESQLAVKVVLGEAEAARAKGFEDGIRSSAEKLPGHVLGLVVLLEPRGKDTAHGMVFPAERVAGVNVSALRADQPDAETLARRLERCVLRNLAFLLEVAPSPDPFCATRPYRDLEELDRMGRNFSPPTLQEFQRKARASGAALLDSPLLMINPDGP